MAAMRSFLPTASLLVISLTCLSIFTQATRRASPHSANTNQSIPSSDPPQPVFPPFADLALRGTLARLAYRVISNEKFESVQEIIKLDPLEKKQVISSSRDRGVRTIYLDTTRGIVTYHPRVCIKREAHHLDRIYPGYWSWLIDRQARSDVISHFYGLTALWLNAKENEVQMQYYHSEASSTYTWTLTDNSLIANDRFAFVARKEGSQMKLDSIYIIDKAQKPDEKGVVKAHTKIDSIESGRVRSVEQLKLLDLPTGFGCIIDPQSLDAQDVETRHDIRTDLVALEMEISSTNNKRTQQQEQTTDFIALELLYSQRHQLQLVRRKDANTDVKTIVDLNQHVTYTIDQRLGACEKHHHSTCDLDANKPGTRIHFSNGLQLNMDPSLIELLFTRVDNFYFIKSIGNAREDRRHHFYELKLKDDVSGKVSLITRKYALNSKRSESSANGQLKLLSVTYRLLDKNLSSIEELYQFNLEPLISEREALDLIDNRFAGHPEAGKQLMRLASWFDISQECYLESEGSRAGHDFVWLELAYTSSARDLMNLEREQAEVRASLYSQLLDQWEDQGLTLLRMPKLELLFSPRQDKLTLRLLLLDSPSLKWIFDVYENTQFTTLPDRGDLSDFARDLDHCVNLCRLYRCKLMSFDIKTHLCATSPEDVLTRTMVPDHSVKTYYMNVTYDFDKYVSWSLSSVLRGIQYRQYEYPSLPEKDETLREPPGPQGIEPQAYEKLALDYWQKLLDSMASDTDRKFVFRFISAAQTTTKGYQYFLLPHAYSLEDDPLAEFGLDDTDANSLRDLDQETPPFHRGFAEKQFSPELDKTKFNIHLFQGISLDQCELACLDGVCSSYSYCETKKPTQCTITSIHQFVSSSANIKTPDQILVEDHDCFVAQRDFLSKFNRFENVLLPEDYMTKLDISNAAECAYQCYIKSEPGAACLAFDYCTEPNKKESTPICFLLRDRYIYSGANSSSTDSSSKKPEPYDKSGCDHYSRSYLADFWRIESTEIVPTELSKLKTNQQSGWTVDRCAEQCALKDIHCTGFQFCLKDQADEHGDDKSTSNFHTQSCWLIDAPPREELEVDTDEKGKPRGKGKFIIHSSNCHLFIMRSDASEAELRDLAFNGFKKKDNDNNSQSNNNDSSGGISVLGGLMLYLGVTFLFVIVGSGFVLLKHNSPRFRNQVERLSMFIRRN